MEICKTVGARLRLGCVKISVVTEHITTYEFKYFNKQMQLMTPMNVTEDILASACRVYY